MQFTILSMILAIAAALPVEQRSPLYCDEVQIGPGFGPGPECTPRPFSDPPLPYCDTVQIYPGFGPGPVCIPRDTPHPYLDPENPGGLLNCKDVAIEPGLGLGPECFDPDFQKKLDDFADSQ